MEQLPHPEHLAHLHFFFQEPFLFSHHEAHGSSGGSAGWHLLQPEQPDQLHLVVQGDLCLPHQLPHGPASSRRHTLHDPQFAQVHLVVHGALFVLHHSPLEVLNIWFL